MDCFVDTLVRVAQLNSGGKKDLDSVGCIRKIVARPIVYAAQRRCTTSTYFRARLFVLAPMTCASQMAVPLTSISQTSLVRPHTAE